MINDLHLLGLGFIAACIVFSLAGAWAAIFPQETRVWRALFAGGSALTVLLLGVLVFQAGELVRTMQDALTSLTG